MLRCHLSRPQNHLLLRLGLNIAVLAAAAGVPTVPPHLCPPEPTFHHITAVPHIYFAPPLHIDGRCRTKNKATAVGKITVLSPP